MLNLKSDLVKLDRENQANLKLPNRFQVCVLDSLPSEEASQAGQCIGSGCRKRLSKRLHGKAAAGSADLLHVLRPGRHRRRHPDGHQDSNQRG